MQGFYHAAGSMLVNQVRLENISNNLSNLNTPGYKRSTPICSAFAEVLLHRLEKPHARGTTLAPVGLTVQNIAVEEIPRMHTDGALLSTGRDLDLALQGEGFFVLDTPRGRRYTRDGHFQLDNRGVLVHSLGFPVMGEAGPITLSNAQPVVDREGNLYQNGEHVGRLQLLSFAPQDALWKDGYNLYQAADNVRPLEATGDIAVFQGYLEESNSELAREMTDLIRVRRNYEAAQKLFQVYDRMFSRAANELGSLR